VIACETTLEKIRASAGSQLTGGLENMSKEEMDVPVVRVDVHDEGEGIAPEDQQRIFEKFVRASRSLTTPVRGTGLGLFISRRYIEAMGGKLWLEASTPGEGSVFSFYLPQMEAPPKEEQDTFLDDII